VFRVGGACGPPPPVAASRCALRAPSRGDPPRTCVRASCAVKALSVATAEPSKGCATTLRVTAGAAMTVSHHRAAAVGVCSTSDESAGKTLSHVRRIGSKTLSHVPRIGSKTLSVLVRRAEARTRGVAAGRSAQREARSSDWRRGAAGSPDPEHLLGSTDREIPTGQPGPESHPGSPDPRVP
jgi:hypothetical protein